MNALDPPVVVSRESTEEGAEEVVCSNVTIVNALFDQLVHVEEIAPDALLSYYVDYYLAEVCNGGFSRFCTPRNYVESRPIKVSLSTSIILAG